MGCNTPGFAVLHCVPELAQIHVHWVGDAIQPSYPLSPLFLPSVFPRIRVLSKESALCIMWPKYWSFSFSITPSNEYSRLISFRIDWFDLAVQWTLKSVFQHHSSKGIDSLAFSLFYRKIPLWGNPQLPLCIISLIFLPFPSLSSFLPSSRLVGKRERCDLQLGVRTANWFSKMSTRPREKPFFDPTAFYVAIKQ